MSVRATAEALRRAPEEERVLAEEIAGPEDGEAPLGRADALHEPHAPLLDQEAGGGLVPFGVDGRAGIEGAPEAVEEAAPLVVGELVHRRRVSPSRRSRRARSGVLALGRGFAEAVGARG